MNNKETTGQIDEALSKTARDIRVVVGDLADLLIKKNEAYGDSALNPQRIFSSAPADEQIKVRLDDKLNRIRNATLRSQSSDAFGEDVIKDLMGYLVLLRVHQIRNPLTEGTGSCNAIVTPEPRPDFLKDIGADRINEFIETLINSECKYVEQITKLKEWSKELERQLKVSRRNEEA
jgi:hypothetical protein